MNKNILIIPSWFSVDGLVGSFFREQAEILNEDFDVRFLFGQQKKYDLKNIWFLLIHFKKVFNHQVTGDKNIYYFFEFPYFSFFSVKFNLKIKKRFYKEHLIRISKKYGWTPELIHAQSTIDAGIIAYYLSIVFTKRYIVTEHNMFLLSNVDAVRQREAKPALENANKVLVVSHDKGRQILMHGIYINPLVVGNLVNENYFYYKPRKSNQPFTITIVGHFSFIKDYPTFFEAMKVVEQNTQIEFIINCVGFNYWYETDNSSEIKALAKTYHLTNVNFTPRVSRENMNAFYWGTDIFVLTSIAEGLPVSALEALACGRPVFATHCGGLEDIINYSNGAIVPIKSPQLLAQRIIDHMEERQQFDYEKISEEILTLYGIEPFREKLKNIYSEVLA